MIRVLIVEDDALIAAAHEAYVQRVPGFAVAGVAHTARAAVRAASDLSAAGTPADLVLLDLGLPDASGIAVASALSGLRPVPDLIAITSDRDLAMVRSAVAHGVVLYLLKPFTFAAFRDKLERYVEYRAALPTGGAAATQSDVDRAMAALRTSDTRAAAPKGYAAGTHDLLAQALRDSESGLTASEAAKAAGVFWVTAWRYLEKLADDRVAERETLYGGTGRPEVRYRWRG